MTEQFVLSNLARLSQAAKWRKSSVFFYKDTNAETIAYFAPFFKGELLRVQFGVANRILNRAVWDLYGLPQTFGTPKEQLSNAVRCNLYFACDAVEIRGPEADARTAADICDHCLTNAEPFASVEKIQAFLEALPLERQKHVAADRLCVALARGDRAAVSALIATAEREEIAFDLSIFALAKRRLSGVLLTGERSAVLKESPMANVKYDDASWHSDGDFPEDLPPEAAATHVGMYLAWAILRGLAVRDRNPKHLANRRVTPGAYCLRECDGKLLDQDLNDDGNRFSAWYYDTDDCRYYRDLEQEFGRRAGSSLYHVEDSWASFDRLAKRLDARLREFRSGNR